MNISEFRNSPNYKIVVIGACFLLLFGLIKYIDSTYTAPQQVAAQPAESDVDLDKMSIEERAKYERLQDSLHPDPKRDAYLKSQEAAAKENQKNIARLKAKFNFKKDEFDNSGWYTHKIFGSSSNYRKTLKTHVNESGYIYLESQWYDEDWLFHTNVQVKVNDIVYKSDVIETYDKNNVRQNDGGVVWENISYINNGDNGIIQAIAVSEGTVKIRFEGREFRRDITLPEKDRQAIKECYALAQALKGI